MSTRKLSKMDHDKLCRSLCLLFNRSTMYTADHPYIQQAVGGLFDALAPQLSIISPLAFILNRDQLYLDEELVDPRINQGRIVSLFKKTGIQSISYNIGLKKAELNAFMTIFTAPERFPDAGAMQKGLLQQNVQHLKINHVFYKKVTMDDAVVRKDAVAPAAAAISDEAVQASKKKFMETMLQSVLSEEVQKTMSVKNLMADPGALSQQMLTVETRHQEDSAAAGADSRAAGPAQGDADAPGAALMFQLQVLHDDVQQRFEKGETGDLAEMTDAIFEMKRQLIAGIETQKTLNAAYENEDRIREQVNALTDNVLIQLVRDEYQKGKISTQRLAHILRRLIPEPAELKRLLPKIKSALLAEGMPVSDYLTLIQQLGKELQSEGLSGVLAEAAESVGVDGEELIAEIRKKPQEAAQLMALAAEIRKGTGDESAFTELLVDYVEKLGIQMRGDAATDGGEGESHVRQVMDQLETGLVKQLQNMNFSTETLAGLEERIQSRIDALFEEQAGDWVTAASGSAAPDARPEQSLLQMMEQGVTADKKLIGILKAIRDRVEAGEMGENDFEAIYGEMQKQEATIREKEAQKEMPTAVLRPSEFKFYLEKEISRSSRHGLAFSTLSFTVIKVQAEGKLPKGKRLSQFELLNAVYRRLVDILRDTDIVAELERNKMAALLPMTTQQDANLAMRRITKLLHETPIEVDDIPIRLMIACAATIFDSDNIKDADTFLEIMNRDLDNMAQRVKNLHNIA